MEAKIAGYVARDKDGELYFYKKYPIKGCSFWCIDTPSDVVEMEENLFQELTFENSPIKVEITFKEVKE